MPSTINASNSGSGGIVQTADASGVLQLQTAGTTALTIDTSQNVGIGTTSLGTIRLNVRGDASANTAGIKISHPSNVSNGFELGYLSSVTSNDVSIWNWENGFMRFATNGSERMRLDASGNLIVGATTTRGTAKLDVRGDSIALGSNATYFGTIGYSAGTGLMSLASESGGGINFLSGATERARIDSSGVLLVGKTSDTNTANGVTLRATGETRFTVAGSASNTTIAFFRNGSASEVGSITTTSTATSYVTSSDYRLKNTIAPMTGALAKVAQLKPVTYKWNADGSDGEGFIAHELAEVCPNAVTGEKDAVETYTDAEGNEQTRPKYQGIDTSFLVATLTAAIKEQQALIESLTQRITALEGA